MLRKRRVQFERSLVAACLVLSALSGGCASWSNPTLYKSIPVHRLPPEVFGRAREDEKTIPLTLLRQEQREKYTLDTGDVLGVYVDKVLGDERLQTPQLIQRDYGDPDSRRLPPAVGTPIVVHENGTITLPQIDPMFVRGKSVSEVEQMIRKAYLDIDVLKPGKERVIVSLYKQRTYHVTVIRQDSGGVIVSAQNQLVNARRGTGVPLDLPAGENDVLTALARSGGLPGLDASNTVVVQRGSPPEVTQGMTVAQASADQTQIRIPLRMRLNDPLPFKPEDIVLKTGDIIFIESRETEVYYTAGLLPVGEFVLPRDYDLDVMEAITQTRGPLFNGGVNFNNLNGSIFTQGIGFPSPSLVTIIRKTPGCGQISIRVDLNRAAQDPRERVLIKPGDFIILQETMGESLMRFSVQTFRLNFFFRLLNRQDASITTNFLIP